MAVWKRAEDERDDADAESGPQVRTRSGIVPAMSGGLPKLWDDECTEITKTTGLLTFQVRSAGRPRLKMMTGCAAGQILALEGKARLFVGRSRTADIRVDAPGVSRVHCHVVRRDDELWIEDADSTNGTIVNGASVKSVKLVDGDRIQLGPECVLQFGYFDEAEDSLARRLFEASTRDELTAVYNRRFFMDRLESETALSRRNGAPLAMLLVDIDGFRGVNDGFGREVGDHVLRAVTRAVGETTRAGESLCRYGGDELALLVREPLDGATRLAERLRAAIEELRIQAGRATIRVTVTVAVAEIGERGAQVSTEGLLRVAEKRLARAKLLGTNRIATT